MRNADGVVRVRLSAVSSRAAEESVLRKKVEQESRQKIFNLEIVVKQLKEENKVLAAAPTPLHT
jgi:hypothetical protein